MWILSLRTVILLSFLICLEGSELNQSSETSQCTHTPTPSEPISYLEYTRLSQYHKFMSIVTPREMCGSDDESETAEINTKTKRPKCTPGKGCDVPLNCYNYTLSDSVLGVANVISVSPMELQKIVENGNITHACALVMFYASWCEHSVQFARRYNTVGRMYRELPVLVVDLSAHDPHKYVLAYLPVVAFYHQGRVVYRFKLTESIEELREMISLMTKFPALNVSVTDRESEGPVPTVRTKGETPYVYAAVVWIALVVIVMTLRTSRVTDCLSRLWGDRAN